MDTCPLNEVVAECISDITDCICPEYATICSNTYLTVNSTYPIDGATFALILKCACLRSEFISKNFNEYWEYIEFNKTNFLILFL